MAWSTICPRLPLPGNRLILGAALSTAAILALSLGAQSGSTGLRVEATLRDGKAASGSLLPDQLAFQAVTDSGAVVPVKLGANPDWALTRTVLEISWSADDRVYVIRALNWTGEVSALRGALPVRSAAGTFEPLALAEVTHLVITQ